MPVGDLATCLAEGGDSRLTSGTNGRTRYGTGFVPHPGLLAFGSVTANTISPRGYAAAASAYTSWQSEAHRHGRTAALAAMAQQIREQLASLLRLPDGTAIVLAPSGTDALLQATALVAMLDERPLASVVLNADETGSGAQQAAALRQFDHVTALGSPVRRGAPLAGFATPLLYRIPARESDGTRRIADVVDRELLHVVTALVSSRRRVLLHAMECSKLGGRAPATETLELCQTAFGDNLLVLVDACQLRGDLSRVAMHLGHGRMVLVTGSKFLGGPAFSGALLVPATLAARLGRTPPPAGLRQHASSADWPIEFPARFALPAPSQIGPLLRWQAALAELAAYDAIPAEWRRHALRQFASAVQKLVADRPGLTLLPSAEPDAIPTVFPILVTAAGQLDLPTARAVHAALPLGADDLPAVELGQPIALADQPGAAAPLRLAAGAQLVTDAWAANPAAPVAKAMQSAILRAGQALDTLLALAARQPKAEPPAPRRRSATAAKGQRAYAERMA